MRAKGSAVYCLDDGMGDGGAETDKSFALKPDDAVRFDTGRGAGYVIPKDVDIDPFHR